MMDQSFNLNSKLKLNFTSKLVIPPNSNFLTFKADSGASKHYVRETDMKALTQISNEHNNRRVILPNNEKINVTKRGILMLNNKLSMKGKEASVLPNLKNTSLLSLGQLCDDNCEVWLNKKSLKVIKDNKTIITGERNNTDGLWDVRIPIKNNTKPREAANVLIKIDGNKADLANYIHACMFSPNPKVLQKAINNKQLLTWPGIDKMNFEKYVQDNVATNLGHMKQERASLRTTKNVISEMEDVNPPMTPKSYEIASQIFEFSQKQMSYGDLTGAFPYTSSRGNKYIYIMYDWDSNIILAKAIPNRQAATIKKAWEELYQKLTIHGHEVKHFMIDNEISKDLVKAFKKYNIQYQLVPPHIHRRNAAERAIQTFKGHFMAGLATCHSKFPIREWDRLIEQAELTLNLLRTSRVNPKLSAWAYVNGPFDFNATPVAPPGTKLIIHRKKEDRRSWEYHGKIGWYIGPAKNHYRCVKCYIPSTHAEIVIDTAKFLPELVPIPYSDKDSLMTQILNDIKDVLRAKNKLNIPKEEYGSKTRNALQKIAELLGRRMIESETIKAKATGKTPGINKAPVKVPAAQPPRVRQRVESHESENKNFDWADIQERIRIEKLKQKKSVIAPPNNNILTYELPTPKVKTINTIREKLYKMMQPAELLNKKDTTLVQSKVGTFLYYGRAVDPTILVALNQIGTEQSKPTEATIKKLEWLMDFLHTNPNAVLRYYAGTMQLKIESDAAYLVIKGAKSRIAGHFYLESTKDNFNKNKFSAPILTECSTLRNVVRSAAEAECGGLFHNAQKAIIIRRILTALHHKQNPTEIKTDNSTANAFVHSTMRQKRSKTWDMRWNWLREKQNDKTLKIIWDKGKNNKADLFTKTHSATHMKEKRHDYILKGY